MNEMYSLRWNNHQMNFINIFKKLFELEELVDVTLSVEGKHIKAHKIILSACSPYFKLLFTMHSNKHPIVILNDVKYNDLKTIIEFMYFGEINVPDERLADILDVAEHLQVRGLYDPKTTSSIRETVISKNEEGMGQSKEVPKSYQNEASQQNIPSMHTINSTNDSKHEPTSMLDLNVAESSFQSDHSDQVQQDFSFQLANSLPNFDVSLHEVDPRSLLQECLPGPYSQNYSMEQSMPYIFHGATHNSIPGPGPGRRRSMKVQESENFRQALEAVRSGSLGFCKAAKLYGLNNRTLWLEYKKRGYPSNRPPVRPIHKQRVSAVTTNTS